MVLVSHPALEIIGSGLILLLPWAWMVVLGWVVLRILRNRRWPKLASGVVRAAGALPATWLAAFFALVLLARLKLGEWPYHHRFDPRPDAFPEPYYVCPVGASDFPPLYWPIFLLWAPVLLSPLLFVPAWWENGRLLGRDWRPCAAFLLSYGLLWAFWMNDPGGFLEWYWD